jgi:hypothetical protein
MKTVLWENSADHSIEYCEFREEGHVFAGSMILLLDQIPTRVAYTVHYDAGWRTRRVYIQQKRSGQTRVIVLGTDEGQIWRNRDKLIPFATGLYDVDLEISPATNSLPIRRLNLAVGESREISAVWVRFPSLTLERLDQRYTRIGDRLYQYEAPTLNFQAKIEVDESGIVVNYEGLWRRIDSFTGTV